MLFNIIVFHSFISLKELEAKNTLRPFFSLSLFGALSAQASG